MRQVLALQIGVARGAIESAVHRGGEPFSIDKQGDCATAALGSQTLVAVTGQTVVAGRTLRRLS